MVSFNKSKRVPPSLAAQTSHTGSDVISQLRLDFRNKCYICEDKGPTSLNVEHFDEHRGNVAKKYDWLNLFYACSHCNSVKQFTFPTGSSDLLNCTDPTQKVDYWIEYRLKMDDKLRKSAEIKKNIIGADPNYNTQTDNTVKLLDRVYNGSGTAVKDAEAENLLKKVIEEVRRFQRRLLAYKEERDPDKRNKIKDELIEMLSYEAPFAAFKRWMVRDLGMVIELPFIAPTDGSLTLLHYHT